MNSFRNSLCVVIVAALAATPALGQVEGLAAIYPRDVGIGNDNAVLFHDVVVATKYVGPKAP